MNRSGVLRTLAGITVCGLLVSTAWNVHGQTQQLRAIEARIVALDQKIHQLAEARKLQPIAAAAADAMRGKNPAAAAAGARAGRKAPTAGARDKTRNTAFAGLLDRLYDIADQLADEEDWTPETYDRVSEIFEWTASEMMSLQQQVQQKKVPVADAKQRAIDIRDQAGAQLGEVLGPDAMTRLKQAWIDDRTPR